MNTTDLAVLVAEQMTQEYTALSYMIKVLKEEGFNPEIYVREQKVYVYVEFDDSHYSIETTAKGYKLIASYVDWDNGEIHDIKIVERVYAETIIDNINRIEEGLDYYFDVYLNQKKDWKQRRKQLHKNEVLKDLITA